MRWDSTPLLSCILCLLIHISAAPLLPARRLHSPLPPSSLSGVLALLSRNSPPSDRLSPLLMHFPRHSGLSLGHGLFPTLPWFSVHTCSSLASRTPLKPALLLRISPLSLEEEVPTHTHRHTHTYTDTPTHPHTSVTSPWKHLAHRGLEHLELSHTPFLSVNAATSFLTCPSAMQLLCPLGIDSYSIHSTT